MKRYYHALNASSIISAGGFNFRFECYTLCGTWMGVYVTEDEEQIKALEILVSAPNSVVTEIDQVEYDKCLKKKPSRSDNLTVSLRPLEPTKSPIVLDAAQGGSSIDPNPEPDYKPATIINVEESIKTGKVRI